MSSSESKSVLNLGKEQSSLVIGLDVGSTTVKAVVINPESKEIIWQDYRRHETKQAEVVQKFLNQITNTYDKVKNSNWRIFITGSGGGSLAPLIGARFVHEVNSVTVAVEKRHPDAGSVIELGGQDAKIIIWKKDEETGSKKASTSMNDKCAGGTGATIDKIVSKVGMKIEDLVKISFDDKKLHHIAGKCGVFAETDVVNLLKASVPSEEIMASLAEAIIKQNLSVLTRGSVLRHNVYLLGGPNTYLPFLQEGWKKRIPEIWKERKWQLPENVNPEDLIIVPKNAQYYAAYGAALFGLSESDHLGIFKGLSDLKNYITNGRKDKLLSNGACQGLIKDKKELEEFKKIYSIPVFKSKEFIEGSVVEGFIGIDGGSTSTKGVLINEEGKILVKAYQLSNGNPIQDTKEILLQIKNYVTAKGAKLVVKGFGATGYAADVLEESLSADVNIVETVAHMQSAVHFYGDIDVIVDVGGQDIKVLFMENKRVKDFKLNTQCSAGNGYFLQGMAQQFGIDIKEYADYAFQAEIAPIFNYGCAVFMEQDKVNFQQQGWQKEEMMAGLALVLPLNIWQYVVQEPNLKKYGHRFVLQGGTQYNLSAVKSQVDYIKAKVPGAQVYVHKHAGESGAIGAAIESVKEIKRKGKSSFVGLEEAINIGYTTQTSEKTRCRFCPNHCSRTFIDTFTPSGKTARYISGFSCEKGTVEDKQALRELNKHNQQLKKQYPNLVDYSAKIIFQDYKIDDFPDASYQVDDEKIKVSIFGKKIIKFKRSFQKASEEWIEKRSKIRIGIPKVLNLYSTAPFWKVYFKSLGIPGTQIIYSDYTSDELWKQGSKWGSIDPCFPSKVANAHIHNLIFKKSTKAKPINIIFYPILTHLQSQLKNALSNAACPIAAGCSEVVKASFTREKNVFQENNIIYINPSFKMDEENFFKNQIYNNFKNLLGVTEDENEWAFEQGTKALQEYDSILKDKGKVILDDLKKNNKIGILMIGRPYHNDPGLNHDILETLQLEGFPILCMQSLPQDKAFLEELFGKDMDDGLISDPMEITDVWKNCYSENSSFKIWAAKVAARHPNLVVVDLSNFKCGHDSPIYSVIDNILRVSKTPYFTFHDIDENKPSGSIKIRTKTIKYFLSQYEYELADKYEKENKIKKYIDQKRSELIKKYTPTSGEVNTKEVISV